MNLLRLIGFKALLICCATLILIKIFLIDSFIRETALGTIQFILLIFSLLCIISAGNMLYNANATVKVQPFANKINQYYTALTITGVFTGFYLCYSIDRTSYSVFFVLTALLLYWYANDIRKIPVIANFYVSVLTGLLLFVVPLFDLLPVMNESNIIVIRFVLKILGLYAVLASGLCFLREVLKDILLMNLHHAKNISSIPLLIGRSRSMKLLSILSTLIVILLFAFTNISLYKHSTLTAYVIFVLIAPLLYLVFASWKAKKNKLISFLTDFLLIIMLLGIASVIILKFTIFRS